MKKQNQPTNQKQQKKNPDKKSHQMQQVAGVCASCRVVQKLAFWSIFCCPFNASHSSDFLLECRPCSSLTASGMAFAKHHSTSPPCWHPPTRHRRGGVRDAVVTQERARAWGRGGARLPVITLGTRCLFASWAEPRVPAAAVVAGLWHGTAAKTRRIHPK